MNDAEGGVVSQAGAIPFTDRSHFRGCYLTAAAAAEEILAASADRRNENKTEKKKKIVVPSLSLFHKHQLSKLGDAGEEIECR